MTVPGAPTSAPQPLAAAAAASRDPLGRCRRRRRPPRLKTPERASAPPHNRTAPPPGGASRHARAQGRRAPRGPAPAPPPPRPLFIGWLGRGRARARALEGGECGSERRVPERPISRPGKRKDPLGRRAAGPRGVRAGRARARAHGGEHAREGRTVWGQRPLPARGLCKACSRPPVAPPTPVLSRSLPRLLHVTSAPPSVARGPATGIGAA